MDVESIWIHRHPIAFLKLFLRILYKVSLNKLLSECTEVGSLPLWQIKDSGVFANLTRWTLNSNCWIVFFLYSNLLPSVLEDIYWAYFIVVSYYRVLSSLYILYTRPLLVYDLHFTLYRVCISLGSPEKQNQ